MKAYQVVENGKPLEKREIKKPTPTGKEILIKTVACGVCHSDVHIHEGFFSLGEEAKLPVPLMTDALAMGHEIYGEVVELGEDVSDVEIGKKYVAYPWIGCGKCPTCHAGDEHLCNAPRQLGIQLAGGFSDYCLIPDEKYLLDYSGIKPGLAATYMCSGLTAFGALKKINNVIIIANACEDLSRILHKKFSVSAITLYKSLKLEKYCKSIITLKSFEKEAVK